MPTTTDSPASLTFLPWVRQGVAAAITTVDTLGPQQPGVVALTAVPAVNRVPAAPVPLRLRGPADVVGIDANQIIRMDPRPGTLDFEPTYFPLVEFDRPDFPWLFSPAAADANARLRPWLCLVVVRKQAGVTLEGSVDAPLPILQIAAPATPGFELPDLRESWAWTHAQVAAAAPAVLAGLKRPELSLSRLICPRVLAHDTDYVACVVPTFELGRKAGLGLPIADKDLVAASALAPAWSLAPAPALVRLPVYHHWEFRTGADGDFASLVARLRPRPAPPLLGRRSVDISRPGFRLPDGFPAGTSLEVEGALQPIPPSGSTTTLAPWPTAQLFQDALAPIVNAPGVSAIVDPGADPLLAPPLYGRWHIGRATVARTGADWFDQLNLDPRFRSVAAFGTRVVQEHQEALMASAWEQAGEVRRVNQYLRQLQMTKAVGDSLHARHVSRLTDEVALRVAAPVLTLLQDPSASRPQSMMARVRSSQIPIQALAPSMRRIGRVRGPISRRVTAQGGTRFTQGTWVATLAAGTASLPVSTSSDLVTLTAIAQHRAVPGALRSFASTDAAAVNGRGGVPWFVVRAEGQPVPIAFSYSSGPPSNDGLSARLFRAAAVEHLTRVNPGRPGAIARLPPGTDVLAGVTEVLVQETRPRQTVAALARAAVTPTAVGARTARSAAAAATTADTDFASIDLVPTFPHPMYEALRDLSQDLMLPGLDATPPDTVLGLQTNRRFVEAYLVGLNFEMGRELLWRGFPTDQRGTYFAQFWGGGADIPPLDQWGNRVLGDPASAAPREQFVLLIRSSLLRRYPNAVIYLTPAVIANNVRKPSDDPTGAGDKLPVFSGSMDPDINFFGFDVSAAQAIAGGGGQRDGYYVVIQQHPTEPRFGLHPGVSVGTTTHVPLGAAPPAGQPLNGSTWRLNSAHMAGIMRRLPVRLAIHASQFLS